MAKVTSTIGWFKGEFYSQSEAINAFADESSGRKVQL